MLMTLCDVDYTYEHVFGLYSESMIVCTLNVILCEIGHWL